MEERENYQTDGHCQLALNVDFSRGYIEGRAGLARTSSNVPSRSRMHVHRRNGIPEYIICIGPRGGNTDDPVQFNVLGVNGESLTATPQDLTAVFGESPDQDFDCSFVAVIIAVPDPATGLKTEPRHVTLITTRNGSYVYDPMASETTLAEVDMADDPTQLNSLNWGYWNVRPRGHIAIEHQSRVYYAGFQDGFTVELTSPLDELQSLIPEMLINQGDRSKFSIGPQFVVWSDEFDPVGLIAYHFLAVEEHEKITGLKSFMEQLVIFTDRSIYVKTGGTDETFQVFKVISDVGCIAPHSIVEVGGVLMFMAKDGVYAFTGAGQQAAVQKISKPIDSIFMGRPTNTYVPEKMRTFLYDRGWPFRVKMDNLDRSNALHVQSRNQIWWGLDLEQTPDEAWSLTLVFDYYHQAWSLFSNGGMTAAQRESFMYDGVTITKGARERIFISSAAAGIFEYVGGTDIGVAAAESNIPMMYISGRMFKENNSFNLYRPIRLKMLSNGDSGQMTNPPFWMAYGEEAHADSQYKNTAGTVRDADSGDRQYTEGAITLHPAEEMNFFYGVGAYKDSETIGTGNGSAVTFSATVNFNFDLPASDHAAPYWTDVTGGHFLTFTKGGTEKTIVDANNSDFNAAAEITSSSWNKSTGAVTIRFSSGNAPDSGTAVTWGVDGTKSMPYQDEDWFTSKVESASIRSRSLRMAFFSGHNRTTPLRGPELAVQSMTVEVVAGDTR